MPEMRGCEPQLMPPGVRPLKKKKQTFYLGAGISFCLRVLIIKFKFMELRFIIGTVASLHFHIYFFRVGLFYYHSEFNGIVY